MSIEPYRDNPVVQWTQHGEAITLGATALGALAISAATAATLLRRHARRSRHSHPVPVAAPRGYHVSVTVVEAWFTPTGGRSGRR